VGWQVSGQGIWQRKRPNESEQEYEQDEDYEQDEEQDKD